MVPLWNKLGLSIASHSMLNRLYKYNLDLAADLSADGALIDFGTEYERPASHMLPEASVFSQASARCVDIGVKHQWVNWQVFRLFQIKLRHAFQAEEGQIDAWAQQMETALRCHFNYCTDITLKMNPYAQDKHSTWVEYLVFNGFLDNGKTVIKSAKKGEFRLFKHLVFDFQHWNESSYKSRHMALQPVANMARYVDAGAEPGTVPVGVLQDQQVLELLNPPPTRRQKIINWIFSKLQKFDNCPKEQSKAAEDPYWLAPDSRLITKEALERAVYFCGSATMYRNTTTARNLQDDDYAHQTFHGVGGLRLIKDCFYAAITENLPGSHMRKNLERSSAQLILQLGCKAFFDTEKRGNPLARTATGVGANTVAKKTASRGSEANAGPVPKHRKRADRKNKKTVGPDDKPKRVMMQTTAEKNASNVKTKLANAKDRFEKSQTGAEQPAAGKATAPEELKSKAGNSTQTVEGDTVPQGTRRSRRVAEMKEQ